MKPLEPPKRDSIRKLFDAEGRKLETPVQKIDRLIAEIDARPPISHLMQDEPLPSETIVATPEQAKGLADSWAEAHRSNRPYRLYNHDPAAQLPPSVMDLNAIARAQALQDLQQTNFDYQSQMARQQAQQMGQSNLIGAATGIASLIGFPFGLFGGGGKR